MKVARQVYLGVSPSLRWTATLWPVVDGGTLGVDTT